MNVETLRMVFVHICLVTQKSNSRLKLGLNRTVHMSILTKQDQTPKFAGQVLPDRTESGLIFLNILPT